MPGGLEAALIVVLDTGGLVHSVGGGEHTAGVPQLHLPLLHQLRGQQRLGPAVGCQFVHQLGVEGQGLCLRAVTVHEALQVEAGQEARDEVGHGLHRQLRQSGQQLLLVPHPLAQHYTEQENNAEESCHRVLPVVVDCVLVGLLRLEVLQPSTK